ncbi:hypothetical protein EL84_11090 [Paenibacillus sp. VT-400]|uniref:hypothetical protein n=1 Tax=Paenibacillus sp. VT-400 TaxID=1495853 RepID=UPI00064AD91C|nr:hypothetical protein [Paenibacillus sp. VT-400]KLU52929.1 hypothetical protein EL84_11090 [Paenibacillus sp. VT-400]
MLYFPEQLISVSKQFAAAQNHVFLMNNILKQQFFEIERQWDGTIAHEIIGHYEAFKSGKAFELYNLDDATYARNFALDEAQASIRAARFAPELTSVERMTLLRDAITRLKNADLRVKDVKNELYIQHR